MNQQDLILLDRSNSMGTAGKWPESLAAINTYVHKLAEDKTETRVSVVAFDKQEGDFTYLTLRADVQPSDWKDLTNADAAPRGWTPLNDAIGRAVAQLEAGNPERAVLIIVTDGEENSSQESEHGKRPGHAGSLSRTQLASAVPRRRLRQLRTGAHTRRYKKRDPECCAGELVQRHAGNGASTRPVRLEWTGHGVLRRRSRTCGAALLIGRQSKGRRVAALSRLKGAPP